MSLVWKLAIGGLIAAILVANSKDVARYIKIRSM